MSNALRTLVRASSIDLARRALPVGVMLLAAASAMAQSGASNREPPTAPIATVTRTGSTDVITLLLVGVLAVAIIGVNFIPSKRGHQD